MPAPPAPRVLALLLANGIHRDEFGKSYILGTFNSYHSREFPATLPRSVVYLQLTDGRGAPTLAIRLVSADEEKELFRFAVTAEFVSPLQVREIGAELQPVTFPAPGVYLWQVRHAGEVIYERRLVVEQIGAQ